VTGTDVRGKKLNTENAEAGAQRARRRAATRGPRERSEKRKMAAQRLHKS
jgi:hypothetical protein